MASKTPQFDTAIEKILKDLKPHERDCKECNTTIKIVDADINFLKQFRVPPPTLCPRCRMQRRLTHRAVLFPVFYKKTCSAPGHNEKTLSFYSDENPVKIYDDNFYISDGWDGTTFGREFDMNRSFFDQFREFGLTVPHQALQKDPKGINSEYVISGLGPKNCYIVMTPIRSENVYYARLPIHCKDCVDIQDIEHSEQCYGSIRLEQCYNCNYSIDSTNCTDSYFLFDCVNCQQCFGCSNLRNKKYCFFNEQLTEEEYKKRVGEINLGKRSVVEEYKKKFDELCNKAIRRHVANFKVENVVGNQLENCRNCIEAYLVIGGSENIRYLSHGENVKETMDVFGTSTSAFLYECAAVAHGNDIKFSLMIRTGTGLEYCVECSDCENCFASFGLKNKKFCIFNKQYSEEEYWPLVDKIKTKMLENQEYGEFFPIKETVIAYNDSGAMVEFPMTKEEVLAKGWYWQDEVESDVDLTKLSVLNRDDIPEDIIDIGDDILEKVVVCEKTGKPFKITQYELDFYRRKKIPIPTMHPFTRMKDRLKELHPFRLWNYPCSKCGNDMYSGYDPEKKFTVYCEDCYKQDVA